MLAIAHAGGALDGIAYTNSLEALDASYAAGFRWFEMDFLRTADGHIACRHDWRDFGHRAPSLHGLRDALAARYTPADAQSLIAWLAAHPDAVLVTDVKEPDQVPVLADLLAAGLDPARTVVQLFSPGEDPAVARLGFPRRSLILYRTRARARTLAAFAEAARPVALAQSLGEARAGARLRGVPAPWWTYTVNDPRDAAHLAASGCSGIFTDSLRPGTAGLTATPDA